LAEFIDTVHAGLCGGGDWCELCEAAKHLQAVQRWVETVGKGQTQMGEKYNWAIGENTRLHTEIATLRADNDKLKAEIDVWKANYICK
jgi:hypothetical protein